MFQIDSRTLYFSYVIVNIINLILIGSAYFQIKKRFQGGALILLSFSLSAIGNILVFFRDYIPDWASIVLANLLIVSSMATILIGLEQFVNKKSSQLHNYILLFIFLIAQSYFSLISIDFFARIINISLVFVILSSQISYLMIKRAPLNMRQITRPVGYVFLVIAIIQSFHILYTIQVHKSTTRYFNSASLEPYFLLSWLITTMLLAYSIVLMYNKRLIINVNSQEEKFSKAFHAAPFAIILSKFPDGEIFEVNKNIETISDYKAEDLIGLSTIELKLWAQNKDREKFISNINTAGLIKENEYVFRKKTGELFPGLITAQVININNEKCIISVVNDITNRKKAELNLINSEASLRELNTTKDKFFSIIAHDLRTPFNGILGFSEILIEQVKEKNYDGIEQYAEIINTSSNQAMDLLSNLMEWTRSQTKRIEFNPQYIDVALIIKSILELLKTSTEQKLLNIKTDIPANIILYADKAMIESVLRNVVSNAIKFTPHKGSILIKTEEKAEEYLISITDTGIGIDPSNLKKLFRIDETYSTLGTNNESGTGLGLILCKDFIDYHKGKIWAESDIKSGSTIFFSLPKTKEIKNLKK